MKIWKMLGCLALLCVIICGCAVLGRQNAAAENGGDGKTGDGTYTMAPVTENEEKEKGGSVTVTPSYSEGLAFRSNGDGTCALSGIGSCTSSCILIPPKSPAGDTVTEILPFALSGSIVGAIEIPAGVTTLTASSFAGCNRLAMVRIAAGNTSFSEANGVLFSADGSVLIYCPSGHGVTELTLEKNLRRINAGAFAECGSLKSVAYRGSSSEWHGIIVGDDNEPLYAAAFRFVS